MGVALGAFGAHALRETLLERGTTGTWETAVFYHLLHASIAWATVFSPPLAKKNAGRAACCWLLGVIIFSGSLYGLASGGPRWLGPITPLGGLLLILGWGYAAASALAATKTDVS